ncbi:PIN domain-containing protein [Curtobacterium sp. MCLR17_054]|uniref:PIN domain-containing protein n=1 Tax=Curtobacterium sp. MCLR17_054 TaxID=2175632 RepID=UPI000DA78F6A|nr:PIN domain-containing protein [Curtobacterium sp. MCLR17_054]WIE68476.1 PIN domain-containing protein [Curtobacterium sp. MCLR17_054]
MIKLRAGVDVQQVIATLRDLSRSLSNIRGRGGVTPRRMYEWRVWSADAIRRASLLLPERELERVVLGSRFTMLHSTDPNNALIDAELDTRARALVDAADELELEWSKWHSGQGTAIILDTNVLMEYGTRVRLVDWHDLADLTYRPPVVVLIPIQVVEELDVLKDRGSDNQKRATARAVLRWLDTSFPLGQDSIHMTGAGVPDGEGATLRVWVDDVDRVPMPRADADIIDRVLGLRGFTARTLLISQDRSMQLRARTSGIDARHLPRARVPDEPTTEQPATAGAR